MLSRVPTDVPPARVSACERLGLVYGMRRALTPVSTTYRPVDIAAHRRFASWAAGRGFGQARGVYAFHTAALEIFRRAREQGVFTVLEQEALPFARDVAVMEEEAARHRGWEDFAVAADWVRALSERERAEWDLSDLVVCPSEHVKEWVGRSGGPGERCAVVPYGVDMPAVPRPERANGRPLRVLTAGAVGLRKGTPYVMEAAARLGCEARFSVVGHATLKPDAARALARTVELLGPTPRAEMPGHYAWADVFLLPTLSDGSATVCYEALAAGRPVITTAAAGSVVRDGVDGFIVPPRDAGAIVDALRRLAARPALMEEMAARARERAAEFTVARYGERLAAALGVQP
jgi:glycosyltransferase involved in cell wall biosynthesis